jgi:hypothetical protein
MQFFKILSQMTNLDKNQGSDKIRHKHVIRAWYQVGVAASILAMLSIGLYFYTNRTIDTPVALSESKPSK